MTGIINFFREGWFAQVVGKLFYFGGEPLDNGDGNISPHYLNCSNPDISPDSCDECEATAAYSDGSFVKYKGDNVYNISEVKSAILEYYNELGPDGWDQAEYRPYRWTTVTNQPSPNKYKTVHNLLDKDDDLWYALIELKQPTKESFNYLEKLREHFQDD